MRFADRIRRSFVSIVMLALALTLSLALSSCVAKDPPATPEESCISACAERAKTCNEGECRRGCNFSLDRIIERELTNVLACVQTAGKCDDPTWARCNVEVGVHADGGPPAPPPPEDE